MYVSHFVLIKSATLKRFDSVNVVGGSLRFGVIDCHHLHANLECSGVFQW